jgi:DNA-binding transcriptional regulator YiaG
MNIRKASVSHEEVVNACKQLKKEKKEITSLAVRVLLGKGSYSTIGKHILNYKHKVKFEYNICSKCHGSGKTKARLKQIESPDTNKMRAIMKRNKLNNLSLAKTLGISSATVHDWFHFGTNSKGKIKKLYFDILKMKGFK